MAFDPGAALGQAVADTRVTVESNLLPTITVTGDDVAGPPGWFARVLQPRVSVTGIVNYDSAPHGAPVLGGVGWVFAVGAVLGAAFFAGYALGRK